MNNLLRKPKKDNADDISGEKSTEFHEGIEEVMQVKRTGSSREVHLQPIE